MNTAIGIASAIVSGLAFCAIGSGCRPSGAELELPQVRRLLSNQTVESSELRARLTAVMNQNRALANRLASIEESRVSRESTLRAAAGAGRNRLSASVQARRMLERELIALREQTSDSPVNDYALARYREHVNHSSVSVVNSATRRRTDECP